MNPTFWRLVAILITLVAVAVAAFVGLRPPAVGAKAAPSVTFALTANTKGVLESCGCGAVKYGGLPERAQMLMELKAKYGASLVVLDSGDTFNFGDGPQKDAAMAQSLVLSGTHAVNFGDEEAAISLEAMLKAAPPDRFPWVATNLVSKATGKPPFPTSRIVQAGGVRVGIMGVLAPGWRTGRSTSGAEDVTVADPVAAVAREMKTLRGKCDLVVLLAHLDRAATREIVDRVPGIHLVVGGDTITDVPHAGAFGAAYFAQGEGYCRNIMLVTMKRTGSWKVTAVSTQRTVYKAKRYPPVAKLAERYVVNASKAMEELISRTYGQSPGYEGDQKCLECHQDEHAQWASTRHPGAWETLKKAGHRYDPDCLGCHTTGEPGKPSTALKGVQCEACHGPFAGHDVMAQTRPRNDAEWAKICLSCHTEQRSPGFNVQEALAKVKHTAK